MSKRALKTYLKGLKKVELEEQILDLYQRFKEVKTYYDFTFNPREEKLITDAKFKINHEYFPKTRRKPRARRSVAQKYFKHFLQIGLDAPLLADLMVFNIETAQKYNRSKPQRAEAFYKSIANSFDQVIEYIKLHSLEKEFKTRLEQIVGEVGQQGWYNLEFFEKTFKELST